MDEARYNQAKELKHWNDGHHGTSSSKGVSVRKGKSQNKDSMTEMKKNFQEKVKPYAPVNLLERERKRNRAGPSPVPLKVLDPFRRVTISNELQTVEAWPVLRSAGEKRRHGKRKKMSQRQRLGLRTGVADFIPREDKPRRPK